MNQKVRVEEAKTIAEFLSVVSSDKIVSFLSDGTMGALFRGHSDESYKLLPSIYRLSNTAYYEREMVREFENNSNHLIDTEPRNKLEWLFLMQHHGLPTRLLDWTESAIIALFFCVESTSNVDGCVWILDPWLFNRKALKGKNGLPASNSKLIENYLIDPEAKNVPRYPKSRLPMVVRNQRNSMRAVNQKAMVTIHGKEAIAMEDMAEKFGEKPLSKIVIPREAKSVILDELMRLGISYQFIYPGLDSLSKDLVHKYSKMTIM